MSRTDTERTRTDHSLDMHCSVAWVGVLALVLVGCSQKERAPAGAVFHETPSAGGSAGSTADPADSASGVDARVDAGHDADETVDATVQDATELPDYGPVPDAVVVDGPTIPPPADLGPLTWCASDALLLSGAALSPSNTMPPAFSSAWSAAAANVNGGGGVVLMGFSGLTSNPQSVTITIGSPDPQNPSTILANPVPMSNSAGVDATTRVFGSVGEKAILLMFIDPSSGAGPSVFAGAYSITGTFSASCDSATDVTLTLKIPTTEGAKLLNGTPLEQLLGPADTVIGPKDAWSVTLTGDASKGGG